MKKIIAAILALILLAASVSCAGQNPETPDEAEVQSQSPEISAETPAAPEEETIQLGIPEEDNGGRDFHILVPTEKSYEFVTEATGEVVNDAVLERSMKTEELFGIKFSYQNELGGWDTRDSYNNFIKNAVLAGDASYDVTTGFIVCTLPIYLQGSLLDLTALNDLNLDNPWWMNNQFENLNVDGHLFCAFGDANLSVYKDCAVIYFNKQVLEDYSLEDPYTLVREGAWVMPKLLEMSEAVLTDLDGNGKIEAAADRIGTYGQGVPMRAFQTSLDVKMIDVDEEGNRCVAGLTERMLQAYEWINLFRHRDDLYPEYGAIDFYQFCSAFAENRALFHNSYIYIIEGEVLRNMEADFGIVPYPKFDEAQETYKTQIGTSSNVDFLPKTASDPELSCRVLEALNYYSMLDVIPTYYTVALESKYTRDTDVPEMLALIRDGMTMDFAFAYSTCFNNGWPNTMLVEADIDLASRMKSVEKVWKKDLKNLSKPIE